MFEPKNNKFSDQKYLEYLIKKVKNILVIEHPGVNLAPWNLENKNICKNKNLLKVDNHDLIFFHFHGLEIGLIGKHIALFLPAPGYKLINNNYQLIYNEYINSIKQNLRGTNTPLIKFKTRSLKWWAQSLLSKKLIVHLFS